MTEFEKTYSIIIKGTPEERSDLLSKLPQNPMKESAKSLINSSNPTMILLAFGTLLPAYCQGISANAGMVLGHSLYKYGKELFLSGKYPDLFLMTVTGYASNYINAIINLGKFEEAYNFIELELPFWEIYESDPTKLIPVDQSSFMDNLKSILVAKINVLIQLNHIDEAWELAFDKDNRAKGNWATDIELNRLQDILKDLKTGADKLDKSSDQRKSDFDKRRDSSTNSMFDTLKKMMELSGLDTELAGKLSNHEKIDPFARSGFEKLEDILSKGESFLQRGTNEVNEISIRQKIRRASGIFVDSQPPKEQILNSLEKLKQALIELFDLGNNALINDTYHGLSLCYSRLGKSSEAADNLIKLWKNLEKVREGINDPMERGGIFQTYPYLFYSMIEHLYKSERYDEMLDAIEGSKGRTIVDTLEKASGFKIDDFKYFKIRERLSPLLAKENAHYVSFHVDDSCSYVSIVTKKGSIYCDQIPIGKDKLNKWYNKFLHRPDKWSSLIKRIDIINELNPLILKIKILVEKGEIVKDDHICYSADNLLYLFPLHYLTIGDKSLIELNTVSRIHNAAHLINLLSEPVVIPESCLTIEVPAVDNNSDASFMSNIGVSSKLLENIIKNNYSHLHHSAASIHQAILNAEHKELIHFSTHGFFPLNGNPFDNSGLLLADKGKQPKLFLTDPDHLYKDDGEHLMSPERFLKFKKLHLNNTHISLQACVAGYALEGIGGDALGLEWAFFQKGAGSLISTFWNVDLNNSNDFFNLFYGEWLRNNSSKAIAHQKALMQLKENINQEDLPKEYFWAGFGLIGDWR